MRAFTGPAMNPEYEKALAAIRAALDAPAAAVWAEEKKMNLDDATFAISHP